MKITRNGLRSTAFAASAALVLALTACGTSGGASNGEGGEGVEYGASQEEYAAAFEDLDEITLVAQHTSSKGSISNESLEQYLAAITEWSGGKINFEVFYSSAIAPYPEAVEALADGRLDIAGASPSYDPSTFPAWGAEIELSTVGSQGPIDGPAQLMGWGNQVGFEYPEFGEELADAGVQMIAPMSFGATGALFCREPGKTTLDELAGTTVSVSGEMKTKQTDALGMVPVSMPFSDAYEGLQRGAIDCVFTGLPAADAGGILEVAPNTTLDPEAGLAFTSGMLGMNQDVWNDLPLVAQQLFIDRLDVYFAAALEQVANSTAASLTKIDEFGGEVSPLDDEAREELVAATEAAVDALDDSIFEGGTAEFIDAVHESSDYWTEAAREAGLESVGYDGFVEWLDTHEMADNTAFVQQLMEEIFLPQRPE